MVSSIIIYLRPPVLINWKFVCFARCFFVFIRVLCCDLGYSKENNINIGIGIGLKSDYKYANRIIPITRIVNPPNSPPGSIYIPESSGMKYKNKINASYEVHVASKPIKKLNLKIGFNIAYNRKEIELEEYLVDELNDFKNIQYNYDHAELGLTIYYPFQKIVFGVSFSKLILLNNKIIYSPKKYDSFSVNIPKNHLFLTPNYLLGFSIYYPIEINKYSFDLGLKFRPYLNKSSTSEISLNLIFNLL